MSWCYAKGSLTGLTAWFLSSGVYPSEILPSEIQASTANPENSWPQSLIAEIRASAKDLRAGSSMIMRFCRCVSQVVQVSSRWRVLPGGGSEVALTISSICLDCLHAEYFLHFFGRLYNTGDYLLIFFFFSPEDSLTKLCFSPKSVARF